MSKELKDLIDSVDCTNKAHSDMETIISRLTEEVQRLNFTIDEQKIIIQNQKTKLSEFKENNTPEDIFVLKDLVTNQRQDIIKKEKDIEILQQTIAEISKEFENAQTFQEENEELIYTNKVIVQLTEENETNRLEIESLNNKIKELQEELLFKEGDIGEENQDLINAKKLIFQLTEENGISRVQIESLKQELEGLKTNLQENDAAKTQYIHELDESNKIIDQLTFDNDQYHEKVNYLQQKIEETVKFHEQASSEGVEIGDNLEELKGNLLRLEVENTELKDIINTNISIIESLKQKIEEFLKNISERDEELENLDVKLQKIENANKQLSDLIVELKVREEQVFDNIEPVIIPDQIVFENFPPTLFFKMYKELTNDSKDVIVAQLVEDLSRSNRDLRTYAIKVLSFIKGPKVFDAFKGLVKDDDWIVKLYLIKALQNFENIEKVDMLKELQRDKDIDVREAAIDMLSKSSC
ncbi:Chromosome partition protein Smc [subsurface metagenome]